MAGKDNTLKELKDLRKKINAMIDIEQLKKTKVKDKLDKVNLDIDDLQATKAGITALINQLEPSTP